MTDTENNGWNSIKATSSGEVTTFDEHGEVIEHTPAPEESSPLQHEQLTRYINRIENIEVEKQERTEHIKEIYKEAENTGFDPKIMRKLVAERKLNADEVSDARALLDLYRKQTGGGE